MNDNDEFIRECDNAPRLKHLAQFFSQASSGAAGQPRRLPVVDRRLLPNDNLLHRFVDLHSRRQGSFDQHYHSSIPYRLEEECRMAYTLLRYSLPNVNEIMFYSLGTAEGTMARTLSELTSGQIRSLSCSPNKENHSAFMAFGRPPHAEFFLGPFHQLTKDYISSQANLACFRDGFDIILEDTTFQMYSPNRQSQIEFVSQHLKPDGIFLFLEKFRSFSDQEYSGREYQKDYGFKTHYFGRDDIERKAETVLAIMHECQVTLGDMATAVYQNFKHCVITWNSGNFYGLAASNDKENLRRYLSSMPYPAIPAEYTYGPLCIELSNWLERR